MTQCGERKVENEQSITFGVADREELYISSIDHSSFNSDEWIIAKSGKLTVS